MTNENDFVIDQIGWKFIGSLETISDQKRRFRALVTFLQDQSLTVRPLMVQGQDLPDDFVLRKSDLTPEGFRLMKAAYDRWLAVLDRRQGKDPENVKVLEAALARLRLAGRRQ